MRRRANPERTLRRVLDAPDAETAVARLTLALRDTWDAAHRAGWGDGVSDALDDNPRPRTSNPYGGPGNPAPRTTTRKD